MKNQIEKILANIIPHAFTIVEQRKNCLGSGEYIKIVIAASNKLVNNVPGQYPACVSLNLDLNNLELTTQIFGGNGGGSIYRLPNKEDEREKYLALARVKIPFRKPKGEEKNVLKAVETFAKRYKQAIKDNLEVLPHKDLADYEQVIK